MPPVSPFMLNNTGDIIALNIPIIHNLSLDQRMQSQFLTCITIEASDYTSNIYYATFEIAIFEIYLHLNVPSVAKYTYISNVMYLYG